MDKNHERAQPINEGEEHTVTIESVGAKGDGVAKINNLVVFIPGCKEGERVNIKITQVRQKFAVATLTGEEPQDE